MSRLMIVGEAWGQHEEDVGAPFVGPSGQILDRLLHETGIVRNDCWVTNVFNFKPQDNKLKYLSVPSKPLALQGYPKLGAFWISAKYQPELDRLLDEVATCKPTLIIALGATALWALTKHTSIKKYRGTPVWSYHIGRKVLPTYHPAALMRNWKLRPVVLNDLAKAANEATFPEIRRPRRFIHLEPTIHDLEVFYERYIRDAEVVSFDIETKGEVITEVGFAPRRDRALVVPFFSYEHKDGNYWRSFAEEKAAWGWVRKVCGEKPLVGQNIAYDIQYMWREMRIPCPRIADDTMIFHHSLEPEMEKSLGFLGSIYTNEPSWKFMRNDHSTLKREDD